MITHNLNNYSIIRSHEYEKISFLSLDGLILDVGGSKKSGYHQLIGGDHTISSININADYECDVVGDVEKPFPLSSDHYDHVICFNLLEHVYEFQNVLAECSRVIKTGGYFVAATPFMHHVHGSPDDYFRYTKSALTQLLEKNGFEIVEVSQLGYGLLSLLFQTVGTSLPAPIRRLTKKMCVFLDTRLSKYFTKYSELSNRIPLGYFTIAKKI